MVIHHQGPVHPEITPYNHGVLESTEYLTPKDMYCVRLRAPSVHQKTHLLSYRHSASILRSDISTLMVTLNSLSTFLGSMTLSPEQVR